MAFKVEFLDCCEDPLLEPEKTLLFDSHDIRHVCRCLCCGAYWFKRFYEHIYFDIDKPDSQIWWYVRLTDEETAGILEGVLNPSLAQRPCFHIDEGVVTKTVYPSLFSRVSLT
jgi:hypothetical protein